MHSKTHIQSQSEHWSLKWFSCLGTHSLVSVLEFECMNWFTTHPFLLSSSTLGAKGAWLAFLK